MAKIFLHGMLGRKFGKVWNLSLNTNSVQEAIKAININTGEKFREYLSTKARDKKYIVKLGEYQVRDDVELFSSAGNQEIHIIPLVKGSKSGVGKIFAAFVLVALSVVTFGASTFIAGGALTGWGVVLASAAASLVLGGIVQMLTPVPNFNTGDTTDANSTIFEGNSSYVTQGGSVGLAYGRVLVKPTPISMSIINEDATTTSNTTVGTVNIVGLPGGGSQYTPGDSESID